MVISDRSTHRPARTKIGATTARIATAPVNWNNDDLSEWRPSVPFPRLVDLMRRAGYSATEYGADFPTDARQLYTELVARSMTLCGAYQWLPLRHHDVLLEELAIRNPMLRLLQACDCHHLIVADRLTPERVAIAGHVPPDGSCGLDGQGFQSLADGVALVATHARRFGIDVHIHNHVGTYMETPVEVAALVALLDFNVASLCFDTGHYAYGGGNPVSFLREHADKIGYVHLKDVDGDVLSAARTCRWSFLDALRHIVFAPLGQGIVDIPAIVESLARAEYDGWIVVEQDTCRGAATATAARNYRYLVERGAL